MALGIALTLMVGLTATAQPQIGPRAQAAATTSAPQRRLAGVGDRRPVAVLDLVGDDAAGAFARILSENLVQHDQLAPLADPAIAASLIGPMLDEDNTAIEAARRALLDASDALTRFELSVAAARATAGQAELNNVEPTAAAIALYAELSFVLGQAKLADGDDAAARTSFLLTQRLAPNRVLDPTRYLPDVIAAYRQAGRAGGTSIPVQIRGQGTVAVDGVVVGTAPLDLDLGTGAHVIQLFGPARLARGSRVELTPAAPTVVVLPDARASHTVIVARMRRLVATSSDAATRMTAVAQLARLIGVAEVVIVGRGPGGLSVQAWRDHAPGAGLVHTSVGPQTASAVLADLAPDPRPNGSRDETYVGGRDGFGRDDRTMGQIETKRWYKTRWIQASMLTGALAMIAAAVVLSTYSDEGSVELDPEISF
jgi:hypothetical protein